MQPTAHKIRGGAAPLPKKEMVATVKAYHANEGNTTKAARSLGISRSACQYRLGEAYRRKIPGAPKDGGRGQHKPDLTKTRRVVEAVKATGSRSKAASALGISLRRVQGQLSTARTNGMADDIPVTAGTDAQLMAMLRRQACSLDEMAQYAGATQGVILDWIDRKTASGSNIVRIGDGYRIDAMAPAFASGQKAHEYVSRADNTFLFGVTADNHIGSKYARMDALEWNYDRFAKAKVDRVFNFGNWIEGEARFNRTELDDRAHGMDNQMRMLAALYPRRKGITTYAVAGDDHEGWYAQREGVDIGRYAEKVMRDHGRDDWVNLGFMEAHVTLKNRNTGKTAIAAIVHPGGGSAYADSYAPQKVMESLDGGEKPAWAGYGHWHKMLAGEYRNVFWCLVPSTKDQDTFMRKKRIRSVVGGGIIELEQDPKTGAIISMKPWLWRFFNKGYYENDRWSHAGPVTLPKRGVEEPAHV